MAQGCRVYVGDLLEDVRKEELEKEFSRFGKLQDVWVAHQPPGFAFIEFLSPRDSERAVRALDGKNVCGSRVRVEISKKRAPKMGGRGRGGRGGGSRGGYGRGRDGYGGRDSYGGRDGGRDSYGGGRDSYSGGRDSYRGRGPPARRQPSPRRMSPPPVRRRASPPQMSRDSRRPLTPPRRAMTPPGRGGYRDQPVYDSYDSRGEYSSRLRETEVNSRYREEPRYSSSYGSSWDRGHSPPPSGGFRSRSPVARRRSPVDQPMPRGRDYGGRDTYQSRDFQSSRDYGRERDGGRDYRDRSMGGGGGGRGGYNSYRPRSPRVKYS